MYAHCLLTFALVDSRDMEGYGRYRVSFRLLQLNRLPLQGWRGNVKARHFVLALRDYYMEELASEPTAIFSPSGLTITDSQNPDAWTMKYIDIVRLQPILEAIDDDASGFITIWEVNRFTSSRPRGWR